MPPSPPWASTPAGGWTAGQLKIVQEVLALTVFAGFALWIWFSSVRDDHRRSQDPAAWFELDGESLAYAWDQQAQRFYYYDPVAGEYFYFDDQPAADQSVPAGADDQPEDRGRIDPQSGEQR